MIELLRGHAERTGAEIALHLRAFGFGLGHEPATLADEDHSLLGGDDPGGASRGDLADRVTGRAGNLAKTVGRMLEQRQQ